MHVTVQGNEITFNWDQDDPRESVLNSWTEEDFLRVLQASCEQFLEVQEFLKDCKTISETTFEKDFLEK